MSKVQGKNINRRESRGQSVSIPFYQIKFFFKIRGTGFVSSGRSNREVRTVLGQKKILRSIAGIGAHRSTQSRPYRQTKEMTADLVLSQGILFSRRGSLKPCHGRIYLSPDEASKSWMVLNPRYENRRSK